MSDTEQLDEIASDLCNMFKRREVPLLMLYIKSSGEETAHVRARHACSTLDLISLASGSIMTLAESLSATLGIEKDLAIELALDSISDCLKTAKLKPAPENP